MNENENENFIIRVRDEIIENHEIIILRYIEKYFEQHIKNNIESMIFEKLDKKEINNKIDNMIYQKDIQLNSVQISLNKRMDSLEQDLIDTINSLKRYMEK